MSFTNNIALLALTALTFTGPVWADDISSSSILGTTMQAVKTNLTELGYDVRKVEMEDSFIEVYAVKEGIMSEIYVDAQTGKVVKIKSN